MIVSVYRVCYVSLAETQKALLTLLLFGNQSRYLHIHVCGFIDD